MKATLEEITQKAMELSPRQRLALASFLLELDGTTEARDADRVWDEEIRARIQAVDSGGVAGIPFEQVMSEGRKRLAL